MSEAAEQFEAITAESEMDKRSVIDLIHQMKTHTSGQHNGARGETELSIYKSAKERSVSQLHKHSPLPLHSTSIKLESGCTSEP